MSYVDGNAIAGPLFGLFGDDITAELCTCGQCGHRQAVAETRVYHAGPGTVARCAECGNVLIVVVDRRGIACVDLTGIASMSRPG